MANDYKVIEANTVPLLESKLNEQGNAGFKLVAAFPNGVSGYIMAILEKSRSESVKG